MGRCTWPIPISSMSTSLDAMRKAVHWMPRPLDCHPTVIQGGGLFHPEINGVSSDPTYNRFVGWWFQTFLYMFYV